VEDSLVVGAALRKSGERIQKLKNRGVLKRAARV